MNNVFIVVCTHKKVNKIAEDPIYHFVVGGSAIGNKGNDGYYLDDELEDNISIKNPYYCELTSLYWGWKKNIDAKWIGLVHYRRYFYSLKDNKLGISGSHIMTEDDCITIMNHYKVILPCYDTRPIFPVKELRKRKDKPYLYAEQIIKQYYPDMLKTYIAVAYGYKMAYGNMMVLEKKDFSEYCQWLFDVLDKVDKKLNLNHETIIPRMDGFLSETLLNVWCLYKYNESQIYRMPIVRAEKVSELAAYKGKDSKHDSYVRKTTIIRCIKHIRNYCLYLIRRK